MAALYKRYIPPAPQQTKSEGEGVTHLDEEPRTIAQPRKKRRHKLEAALAGKPESNDDVAPADDDTDRLKKFSGILGKFQKSTHSQKPDPNEREGQAKEPLDESKVVRDLILPLPQKSPTPEFRPDESSLPAWLARPTIISTDSRRDFAEIGMKAETLDHLSKLGFVDALPVQQAVLPVLLPPGTPGSRYVLPVSEDIAPDLAVEAATGSGKTLAYLLPILESLKQRPNPLRRLRALVIVPTRELVQQVAAVAESLSKGSGIKIGMSTGKGRFTHEQQKLVNRGERYDPEEYAVLMSRAKRRLGTRPIDENSDEYQIYVEELANGDLKAEWRLQDAVRGTAHHVPVYTSAVDLLVATPGRLLEHLSSTTGFNLVHLHWLVIDEVDKLLDNQFEGFLSTVNAEITRARAIEEQDDRERFMRSTKLWDDRRERRVRKAMFSATMTRDISKLLSLQLRRPQMIVVRGSDSSSNPPSAEFTTADGEIRETNTGFELPRTLLEYCVPVGDGSDKPLIALELLESKILSGSTNVRSRVTSQEDKTSDSSNSDSSDSDSDDSDSSSSSESDDTSSVSSDSSTSSGMSSSDGDVDMTEAPAKAYENTGMSASTSLMHPDRIAALEPAEVATILIFTSSNESASRLSHLLKSLKPAWASWVTTLTKANANKGFRSRADEPTIVITTDRAARGLDNFRGRPITHVVQYDVPRSLTSYIHRVGRTARAGRKGDAWTLFTRPEGRWFDNEILKSNRIRRVGMVERVKLFSSDQGLRDRFAEAVASMRDEVRKS